MTQAPTSAAFLDASALYPSLLRNMFMRMALREMFRPYWSQRVQDEWTRAVLRDRPHLSRTAVERTRRLMDENIEDASVDGYEHLIDGLSLPDPDDRHVLAAAIHCGATFIITANLRDFPATILAPLGVAAIHPDAFLSRLVKDNPAQARAMLFEMSGDLKNPPQTPRDIVASLERHGMTATASGLAALIRAP